MASEQECYGERDCRQRSNTKYKTGDLVTVGPAYYGSGQYHPTGLEGDYTVVGSTENELEYCLVKGNILVNVRYFDLIIPPTRLTKR